MKDLGTIIGNSFGGFFFYGLSMLTLILLKFLSLSSKFIKYLFILWRVFYRQVIKLWSIEIVSMDFCIPFPEYWHPLKRASTFQVPKSYYEHALCSYTSSSHRYVALLTAIIIVFRNTNQVLMEKSSQLSFWSASWMVAWLITILGYFWKWPWTSLSPEDGLSLVLVSSA